MQQKKFDNNNENPINSLNRLAAVGEIAAGMAHEVRNPLTAVKGFLDLLGKEMPHAYIDIATAELNRAIDTLQNLLQVSKPDMDDEPIVSINLCSELESVIYLFQDQIYRVNIVKKFRNKNEVIYGKKNQLKKVFFNLIKNAHEAIIDKGTITIEHYRLGNSIFVQIEDTGVGIPEDKLNLLGTPFYSTKTEGTGLGLAQVFSTLYNHHAKVEVKSKVNMGTTFIIEFPIEKVEGGSKLDFVHKNEEKFYEFYQNNYERINEYLLTQSRGIIQEIDSKELDETYLLNLVQKIIDSLENNQEHGLIELAKEKGEYWAKMDFSLILIIEWMHLLHQIYFSLLHHYHLHKETNLEDFFQIGIEKRKLLDTFLSHFIYSYTHYKNKLLQSQREVVESLTVPIIPLSKTMAVLPVVGTIDTYRAKKLQEKTLQQIPALGIKRLIIDLSGVAYMDTAVVNHIFKIIDGVRLLGCKAVLTGIRPEIANTVIEMGIKITDYVEAKGSLQQALEEYGLN